MFLCTMAWGPIPSKVRPVCFPEAPVLICPFVALQSDMSTLQFHLDQAFLARQLAETSTARAATIRAQLVERLRRLYKADHREAMAATYSVDHAVTTALEGLLTNPAPLSPGPDSFLIDELLLHADPSIFDERVHPQVAAYRTALYAPAPPQYAPPADQQTAPAPPVSTSRAPGADTAASESSGDTDDSSESGESGSSESGDSSDEDDGGAPAALPARAPPEEDESSSDESGEGSESAGAQ